MGDSPEVSLRAITRGAGLSRQRMRTLLADLERKGFVKIARSDEADKRTRAITVLPKRGEVVTAISRELDGIAGIAPSQGLPIKRIGATLRLTNRLASNLRRAGAPRGKGKGAKDPAAMAQARGKGGRAAEAKAV